MIIYKGYIALIFLFIAEIYLQMISLWRKEEKKPFDSDIASEKENIIICTCHDDQVYMAKAHRFMCYDFCTTPKIFCQIQVLFYFLAILFPVE